jgi:hypothetical protein
MAAVTYADLDSALSVVFENRLARVANRHALLASLLTKEAGTGQNLSWDVETSAATAETYAEAAAAGTAQSDLTVPATLNWARYRSTFGLTGTALAAAQASGNPSDLANAILAKAEGNASKLLAMINADLYSGTGATNIIHGLNTAIDATTAYAGLDKGTYPEWAGTVLANGAVARALTKDLIDQMEADIFDASGVSPNCIVTTSAVARKYEGLFDSGSRFQGGVDLSMLAAMVGVEVPAIPPVMVTSCVGYYKRMPVFRDIHATAGKMYFLNLEELKLRFLPPPATSTAAQTAERALRGNERDAASGLMARIESMAKTTDIDTWMIKLYPQLQVRKPNSCGILADISES